MPRRKPLPNKPSTPRRQTTEHKTHKNYDYCCAIPCINPRCSGFMFLVTVLYNQSKAAQDELECFDCKRIRKLGPHDPKRTKVSLPKRPNKSKR